MVLQWCRGSVSGDRVALLLTYPSQECEVLGGYCPAKAAIELGPDLSCNDVPGANNQKVHSYSNL